MNPIKILALKNFPFVEPDDDLASIIDKSISVNNIKIDDNDVFVIAQKIISKSENRYVDLDLIEVSKDAEILASKLNKNKGLVQAIINESKKIISTNLE